MTTDLLERAMAVARSMSPEMQDDVARMVLHFAGEDREPFTLDTDDEAAVMRSREQALRGDFASDDEIRSIWAKHGV